MKCHELFIPKMRKKYYSDKELEDFISIYNGKKNIYNSVYAYYNEPKAQNAIVDKIFLDFDYDKDIEFYNDVRKVAKYLHDLGARYYIRFSGRGFHIFILLSSHVLINPKAAIRAWVHELHRRTNTKSDMSVVGDLRRVSRTLFTQNLKTRQYCIPIQYADLMNLSYHEICRLSLTCNKTITNYVDGEPIYDFINGDSDVDISMYDNQIIEHKNRQPINTSNLVIDVDFPPCIQHLLKIPDLGWNERRELIIYLRDDGYTYDEILNILEKTLTPEKFHHCVEEEHQVDYLLSRNDILFSSCKTQKINNLCPSPTCPGNNLYL